VKKKSQKNRHEEKSFGILISSLMPLNKKLQMMGYLSKNRLMLLNFFGRKARQRVNTSQMRTKTLVSYRELMSNISYLKSLKNRHARVLCCSNAGLKQIPK
jgi:hypothetical protein